MKLDQTKLSFERDSIINQILKKDDLIVLQLQFNFKNKSG